MQSFLQAKVGKVSIVGDREQNRGADHDPTRTNFCYSKEAGDGGRKIEGQHRVRITRAVIHVGQSD